MSKSFDKWDFGYINTPKTFFTRVLGVEWQGSMDKTKWPPKFLSNKADTLAELLKSPTECKLSNNNLKSDSVKSFENLLQLMYYCTLFIAEKGKSGNVQFVSWHTLSIVLGKFSRGISNLKSKNRGEYNEFATSLNKLDNKLKEWEKAAEEEEKEENEWKKAMRTKKAKEEANNKSSASGKNSPLMSASSGSDNDDDDDDDSDEASSEDTYKTYNYKLNKKTYTIELDKDARICDLKVEIAKRHNELKDLKITDTTWNTKEFGPQRKTVSNIDVVFAQKNLKNSFLLTSGKFTSSDSLIIFVRKTEDILLKTAKALKVYTWDISWADKVDDDGELYGDPYDTAFEDDDNEAGFLVVDEKGDLIYDPDCEDTSNDIKGTIFLKKGKWEKKADEMNAVWDAGKQQFKRKKV